MPEHDLNERPLLEGRCVSVDVRSWVVAAENQTLTSLAIVSVVRVPDAAAPTRHAVAYDNDTLLHQFLQQRGCMSKLELQGA